MDFSRFYFSFSLSLSLSLFFSLFLQLTNFLLIPPHQRVVYIGVVTFVWLNVLCIFKRLDLNNDMFKKEKEEYKD